MFGAEMRHHAGRSSSKPSSPPLTSPLLPFKQQRRQQHAHPHHHHHQRRGGWLSSWLSGSIFSSSSSCGSGGGGSGGGRSRARSLALGLLAGLPLALLALYLTSHSARLAERVRAWEELHPRHRQPANLAETLAHLPISDDLYSAADGEVNEEDLPPLFDELVYEYFPQVQRCGTRWARDYAALHADILGGRAPLRHLVSVAVAKGAADRMVGTVTQLYVAALGRRALTELTWGHLPSLSAVCGSTLFDWTSQAAAKEVPRAALAALQTTPAANNMGDRHLPKSVDKRKFAGVYLVDVPFAPNTPEKLADAKRIAFFRDGNLSRLPEGAPDTPYLLWASNRGRTYVMASNPNHKQQLFEWGVTPETAFTCGWFALCPSFAPPLLNHYRKFWDQLKGGPEVMVIGIQVRVGDDVFSNEGPGHGDPAAPPDRPESVAGTRHLRAVLKHASPYFKCAAKIERAHAAPGQRVVYFLNSDSLALRKAAKRKLGDKLVTDDQLLAVHPDCAIDRDDAAACEQAALNSSMVHAVGSILTFAQTDFQVVSLGSGFGRTGAWLSGRWDNIWELGLNQWACDPHRPTPRNVSALTWSGV